MSKLALSSSGRRLFMFHVLFLLLRGCTHTPRVTGSGAIVCTFSRSLRYFTLSRHIYMYTCVCVCRVTRWVY